MNRSRTGLAAAILLAIPLAIPVLAAGPIVIQNATILTITKGTFKGSVLMRDGKIVEVGEKILVPADAKVIDATRTVSDARHHRLPFARGCGQHQ